MENANSGPALAGVQWETCDCCLCGSPQNKPLFAAGDRLFGCPGRFQLVKCLGCGHRFLNPRPTRDTIGLFYPEDYGPHRENRASPQEPAAAPAAAAARTPWYLSAPARSLPGLRRLYYWLADSRSELIPDSDGAQPRGLEVGCGSGRFLERLQTRGWDAVGVEPAAGPVQRCQERGLNVCAGDLDSVHFDAESFDAIFAWMVIEHLHDPVASVREMKRLLKPGGSLLLSVPNYGCWESLVFGQFSFSLQLPTHLHQFTPRTVRRLLQQSGFRIEQLIHQPNLLSVIGSVGLWLNEQFPARPWGANCIQFTNEPSMWATLALAVPARLIAAVRQAGRITVVARRDNA